jgi:8-oxo-dGTP pyrophosphatase MutT (NUDIX family)
MNPVLTTEDVRRALARPLPGVAAQVRLTPPHRVEQLYRTPPTDARPAGVLIALYPHEEELRFPLTLRRDDLEEHRGQISLPGGAQESGESLLDTALRETHEEIGVAVDASAVLGALSPVYIPPTGFLIAPYVASLPGRPEFVLLEREVAELIEVPLSTLFDPSVVRREKWTLRDVEVEVPFFQIGPHKVWGATAMVLSEFAAVIANNAPADSQEN